MGQLAKILICGTNSAASIKLSRLGWAYRLVGLISACPSMLLHLIQASASVDQTLSKALSQIVDAELRQPCPDACIVPAVEKGLKGFACALVQKTRDI